MLILLASENEHKRRELDAIFKSARKDCKVQLPGEFGIKFEVEEDGKTFLENALIKAQALYKMIQEPSIRGKITEDKPPLIIADDSGLVVDALGGRPGIYSARYGGENGKKISTEARNLLLLKELKESGTAPPWTARFVCTMAAVLDKYRFFAVQETLEGVITGEMRGGGGFGYDPILFPLGKSRAVAELNEEEKNKLSHRGKAAARLCRFL